MCKRPISPLKAHLSVNTPLNEFTDYADIRRDYPHGGSCGLVTLVHNSVPYWVVYGDNLPKDDTSVVLAVEVEIGWGGNHPCQCLCTPGFVLLILMLSWNAVEIRWCLATTTPTISPGSPGQEKTGYLPGKKRLKRQSTVRSLQLQILSFPPASHGQPSSPDITLLEHLLLEATWYTLTTFRPPPSLLIPCPHR